GTEPAQTMFKTMLNSKTDRHTLHRSTGPVQTLEQWVREEGSEGRMRMDRNGCINIPWVPTPWETSWLHCTGTERCLGAARAATKLMWKGEMAVGNTWSKEPDFFVMLRDG